MEIGTKNKTDKLYEEMIPSYGKLAINLTQALELFLIEKNISFLSINHRIKDKESFIEKIERKEYDKPFEQIEDICGIRIVCHYQSDIKKICQLISDEFQIVESQDKEQLLNADQFGYRSTHFIVKIKKEWLNAPNYRGLEDLKAEIQVRTILMHAWAEIEHKLAYKSETQIPKQFKRKLFRISAKLEEADEQFEDIKVAIIEYKSQIIDLTTKKNNKEVVQKIELNLDSLQAFMDSNFGNRAKDISKTASLLDELNRFKISLNDLINYYEITKSYLLEMEKEVFPFPEEEGWAQVGIVRKILSVTNDDFREKKGMPYSIKQFDKKWSEIIKKENARSA